MTALLHYVGLVPAGGERDAWSHAVTPKMLEDQLAPLEKSVHVRRDLRRRLEKLYRLRIMADYHPQVDIGLLVSIRRDAEYMVKFAREALVNGRIN